MARYRAFLLDSKMKINIYYGFKKGQTQIFDKRGFRLTITKITTNPITVRKILTEEKDGYWGIQVIIKEIAKKNKKQILREIRLDQKPEFKVGDKINITDVFVVEDKVQVSGKTLGKGFAGVVKRWGFAGGPRTHGQSDRQRAPGSIGQGTDPGRVWKGKKMPGRMGGNTKTIKGLKIFKVDDQNHELWVTGLVPGSRGGLIKISKLS